MTEASSQARFTATHPSGAVVEMIIPAPTVSEMVQRLDKLISVLADNGWSFSAPMANHPQGGSAPLCPIHNKPMKQSQYGGWYCPVKIADDDGSGKPVYCKATA